LDTVGASNLLLQEVPRRPAGLLHDQGFAHSGFATVSFYDGNLYCPIITLEGADLSGANIGDSFTRLNVWGANLSGADLSYAGLNDANLSYANLSGVNLNEANFGEEDGRYFIAAAKLSFANLNGANLREANFHGANLTDASNLTQPQLDQVYSCFMATLPQRGQRLTCHQNATSDFV
jgi:BTB/POZ domain-containing protein KCTD9